MKEFLKRNLIDINTTGSDGNTPLMIACESGNKQLLDLFFSKANLDYHHRNNKGQDAYDIAKEKEMQNKKDSNVNDDENHYSDEEENHYSDDDENHYSNDDDDENHYSYDE